MRARSIAAALLLPLILMTINVDVATGPTIAVSYDVKRVFVAADEEFRERPDWKAVVEAWISQASSHFHETFGVTLSIVKFLDWTSAATAETELLKELEASLRDKGEWTPGRGNILLGISGYNNKSAVCGVAYLGGALTLADIVLVFDRPNCNVGSQVDYSRGVVVQHEVSHLYSALDRDSSRRRYEPDCVASVMSSEVTLYTNWCSADIRKMKESIHDY